MNYGTNEPVFNVPKFYGVNLISKVGLNICKKGVFIANPYLQGFEALGHEYIWPNIPPLCGNTDIPGRYFYIPVTAAYL